MYMYQIFSNTNNYIELYSIVLLLLEILNMYYNLWKLKDVLVFRLHI